MLKKHSDHLDQVIHLLKRGTERKLQVHGTEEAEQYLREAEDIAVEYDLPKPWLQLVSYRLAHVLLRREGDDELDEVQRLLNTASEANCLGPLPLFYLLAVMSRRGRSIERMKRTFDKIIKRLDTYIRTSEESMEYGFEGDSGDSYEKLTALQHNLFNMAELAAYFTGFPYSGFEGRGLLDLQMRMPGNTENNIFSDLYCDLEQWQLAGTGEGFAQVAYPKAIAVSELESRMEKGDFKPPCITFKFALDRSCHHWNINLEKENGSFTWRRINTNSKLLQFLAVYFLLPDPRKRITMQYRLFGSDSKIASNSLAQQQSRCAAKIAEVLNAHRGESNYVPFSPDDIFLREEAISGYMVDFNPAISINGAIDIAVLHSMLE